MKKNHTETFFALALLFFLLWNHPFMAIYMGKSTVKFVTILFVSWGILILLTHRLIHHHSDAEEK